MKYNHTAGIAKAYEQDVDAAGNPIGIGGYTPLRMHTDPSWLTINIALSPPDAYDHGGVIFPHLSPKGRRTGLGQSLIHPGFVPHQSAHVTRGVRHGFQIWLNVTGIGSEEDDAPTDAASGPTVETPEQKLMAEGVSALWCVALKKASTVGTAWPLSLQRELYFRYGVHALGEQERELMMHEEESRIEARPARCETTPVGTLAVDAARLPDSPVLHALIGITRYLEASVSLAGEGYAAKLIQDCVLRVRQDRAGS